TLLGGRFTHRSERQPGAELVR
ncbi:MAG: hypothetical protein JWM51_384, partial [Microbacteriaceae bacterium]|nr:hypothetical protein [Microbacteriaceae bacterium]